MPENNTQHDIFISYSRKNKDIVLPIKEEIERGLGLRCWIDLSDIPCGSESFKGKVIPGIRQTRVAFLFFLSNESQASEYAIKEINFAKKRAKKRVILIRINDDDMTDEFYFDYQDADVIDWRVPEQKEKLFHDLRTWSDDVNHSRETNPPTTLSTSSRDLFKTPSEGALVICPVCGKKNKPEDTFKCRECGRENLCLRHQDEQTYLCGGCLAKVRANSVDDPDKSIRDDKRHLGKKDQNDANALYQMGLRHKVGNGVERDFALAARYFLVAAEMGYPAAENDYGVCLQNGQGVVKDSAQAVRWYRKAAEKGYAHAQLNLGYCYQQGDGVGMDLEEAVRWYRLAAAQGNAWAQCNLGMCYENGYGVEQDDDMARHWYSLAADQNDATAIKALRRLSSCDSIPISVECSTDFGEGDPAETLPPSTMSCDKTADGAFGSVSGGDFQGCLGGIQVRSVLGVGTYGRVYRGLGLNSGVSVAFKVLRGDSSNDRRMEHFRQICSALKTVDPNSELLARPLRVFTASENDYVADGTVHVGDLLVEMVFAPGEQAETWVKKIRGVGSGWEYSVFDVCKRIAKALDLIHDAGMVHRDVSPANILVELQNGGISAHLCDFDLTAFHDDIRKSPRSVVGTPGFIAPEILTENGAFTPKADQYSLACVLYRLLAGHSPYGNVLEGLSPDTICTSRDQTWCGISKGSAMWKLISSPPPAIPYLNNKAFAKAMSVKPDSRYPSCLAMVEAVQPLVRW